MMEFAKAAKLERPITFKQYLRLKVCKHVKRLRQYTKFAGEVVKYLKRDLPARQKKENLSDHAMIGIYASAVKDVVGDIVGNMGDWSPLTSITRCQSSKNVVPVGILKFFEREESVVNEMLRFVFKVEELISETGWPIQAELRLSGEDGAKVFEELRLYVCSGLSAHKHDFNYSTDRAEELLTFGAKLSLAQVGIGPFDREVDRRLASALKLATSLCEKWQNALAAYNHASREFASNFMFFTQVEKLQEKCEGHNQAEYVLVLIERSKKRLEELESTKAGQGELSFLLEIMGREEEMRNVESVFTLGAILKQHSQEMGDRVRDLRPRFSYFTKEHLRNEKGTIGKCLCEFSDSLTQSGILLVKTFRLRNRHCYRP
ncbi:unnamed protein product [Amoebophrya sp. A25]|nr:unnamed protein product [Amoebophrya sp. A25]|eukprot:GSA25T00015419001.1